MAVKKAPVKAGLKKQVVKTAEENDVKTVTEAVPETVPSWHEAVKKDQAKEQAEEGLDPKEEKMLDWILKGVVAFVLGWLGLSILLVFGGFLGLWK